MNSKAVSTKEVFELKGPVLILQPANQKQRNEWIYNAFVEMQKRLSEYIEGEIVRLGVWREGNQEEASLDVQLSALLQRENWERWVGRGWIPPEWEMVKKGEKREVKVIFVAVDKYEALEAQIGRLFEVMDSKFPGFHLKVAVIWVGDELPKELFDEEQGEGRSSPIFKAWIGSAAVGGGRVSDARRQHTLSTLLVVLSSADWEKIIPVEEKGWWAIGGSSIVVDYNVRLEWLNSEVIHALVGRFTSGLTPEEESLLRDGARKKIKEMRELWAKNIEKFLNSAGWKCKMVFEPDRGMYISLDPFSPKPLHPVLLAKGNYRRRGVRNRGGILAHVFGGVVDSVKYYIEVIQLWSAARGQRGINGTSGAKYWGEEYEKIHSTLYEGLRLDREESGTANFFDGIPEQIGYLVNRSRGSASLLLGSSNVPLPMGLEAAKVWVDELWKGVFNSPWVKGEERQIGTVKEISELGMKVQPDDWRNKGKTDASWLENYWRWYLREQESFMYPEVMALKGVIGWPMVYAGVILLSPDMQGVKGWLISLVVLLLLLISELIWRWGKKERMISHLGSRSREFLRLQVQGIVEKVVRKALLSGGKLARLYTLRQTLRDYLRLVSDYLGEFVEEPRSKEDENVYWLVDGGKGEERIAKEEIVARVIEKADVAAAEGQINLKCLEGANLNLLSKKYEGLLPLLLGYLVERLLSEKEGKASAATLWEDMRECLTEAVDKYVREVVGNLEDLIYILPEREDVLQEGRKWAWLWERAYPLGKSSHVSKEFTTVVVPNRFALLGPEGMESRFWDNEWNVARSVLPYEVSCVRGVMLSSEEAG